MLVEIRDDMKNGFAEEVTEKNIGEIAAAIQEYSDSEVEVTVYYDNEIQVDNKTFGRIDTILVGDWVVINKSKTGYYIYVTKEEMLSVWKGIENQGVKIG